MLRERKVKESSHTAPLCNSACLGQVTPLQSGRCASCLGTYARGYRACEECLWPTQTSNCTVSDCTRPSSLVTAILLQEQYSQVFQNITAFLGLCNQECYAWKSIIAGIVPVVCSFSPWGEARDGKMISWAIKYYHNYHKPFSSRRKSVSY